MDSATALREALARLRRPAVLAVGVGFTLLGVAGLVAQQTLTPLLLERVVGGVENPQVRRLLGAGTTPAPLAIPVELPVAALLFGATALLDEALSIVGLRLFADWGDLPTSARRGIVRAVVVGTVVGLAVKTLVLVGLTLFILPGVFLATALLFAHARVAIAGDGAVAALRESWALTSGNRFRVFGVVLVLLGFVLLPVVMGGLVTDLRAGAVVAGVLYGPANLLATGLVARAYVALEFEAATERAGDDDEDEDGDDPWNQPLGPDDLPEP